MKSPDDTIAPAKKIRAARNGESSTPQPAHVLVGIAPGGWVDVINSGTQAGDDRLCDATWTLQQPAPDGISQPDGPGSSLIVTAPMDIDFDLPAGAYSLAGIAFRRVRGSGPGNGSDNLKKENIRLEQRPDGSSTIHVKDSWASHRKQGSNDRWSWDFYIIVQDAGGGVGIIDPDIENEEGV
jgi:hypothetical protein